ncbi:MAG: NAD(P)-dependent dehydrogenase (short-subunit alcohol dehydrogenase family) [Candidatus Marinamargulisbacteria bacterium]|jgi:NAD(P)-dependent dehydrogenase (short-subunit alcohol dehydrogenase family)
MTSSLKNVFSLKDQVIIITGGAGLMGTQHCQAVAEFGGIPIIMDVNSEAANALAETIKSTHQVNAMALTTDIKSKKALLAAKIEILGKFGRIDGLINNASINPKVDEKKLQTPERFENFSMENWLGDVEVGLTGAMLCSQVFGAVMAEQGHGAIVNISSDLGLIGPDQRLYEIPETKENQQPVKPVSYSVIKHGLIGLTRYLATYWGPKGVRTNALCPGGIYTNQPEDFVHRLSSLIPMGRMAEKDEYQAAIIFLLSRASSYMNGAVVSIDGGRTAW